MDRLTSGILVERLERGEGYYLGMHFQKNELNLIRSLVEKQWLEIIKNHVPGHWKKFSECGIENYHTLSYLLNHAAVWTKEHRILPQNAVSMIRSTSLVKQLEEIFGQFDIADEENLGREEIYWRLVRPNEKGDMGPLHADAWFWELGHGVTPPNRKRVKVWIALYCEPGKNGLQIVSGSHLKEWKYHSELRHGFIKPVIDEDVSKLPIELVYTKPGDAIVFHDWLLHGGAPNNANKTRVSLEFTMFVEK